MPNQHTTEDVMAASRRIVAALDPALSVWEATIRTDERAKVRAELLAIADETDEEGYRRWSPLDARVVSRSRRPDRSGAVGCCCEQGGWRCRRTCGGNHVPAPATPAEGQLGWLGVYAGPPQGWSR